MSRILMCSLVAIVLAGEARGELCDNCYRVQIELAEAHAMQADVDGRIEQNLEEMVSLAEWRDDIQGAMVELLAESDHDTDSWQIRKLLLEWEWGHWSRASTEAGNTHDALRGEKAAIDHTILLLDEALLYDCEAVGVG